MSDNTTNPIRPSEPDDNQERQGMDCEVAPVEADMDPGQEEAAGETALEGVVPKIAVDPGMPTPAERAAHDVTHIPYRSWCEHCNRGRGKRRQHRRVASARDPDVPHAAIDYCFFTHHGCQIASEVPEEDRRDPGKAMTCLVMKDSIMESVFAYAVDRKGAENEIGLAKQMLDDLDSLGLNQSKLVVRSDQEPSVTAVKADLSRQRLEAGRGTAVEDTAVGDSNANGRVERAVQKVAGVTRTLKSALEAHLATVVGIDHPLAPWLVRHAAHLITRYQVRGAGKTSYRMAKGRDAIQPVAEFCEMGLFSPPKTNAMAKASKWQDRKELGIYLGSTLRSNEPIIGMHDGVFTASDIVRRPADERWSSEFAAKVRGTPREPKPQSTDHKIPSFAPWHVKGAPAAPAPEAPEFQPPSEAERAAPTPRSSGSTGRASRTRVPPMAVQDAERRLAARRRSTTRRCAVRGSITSTAKLRRARRSSTTQCSG